MFILQKRVPLLIYNCLKLLSVVLNRVICTVEACKNPHPVYTADEMKQFSNLLLIDVIKVSE